MSKKLGFVVLLSVLSSFLVACESVSNLVDFGKNDDDDYSKKDRKERISVLSFESELTADSVLANTPVSIPKMKINKSWHKSSGYSRNIPENISISGTFNKMISGKIGKGGKNGQNLTASPVVANRLIYTIDSKGVVSAFDVDNIRKKKWSYKIKIPKEKGNFFNAGITYNEGKIYVSTGYNIVLALDALNGKLIWSRVINSIARSAPAVGSGVVLVNTIGYNLYALDEASGSILWLHSGVEEEVSILGSASPVIYGQVAFVPYSSGELYALRLNDGREIWGDQLSVNTSRIAYSLSDIDVSPIARGDIIYAISNDGVLAATHIKSGNRIWEREVSGNKSPWLAGEFLYLLTDKNQIIAVHALTGMIKWVEQLPSYKNARNTSSAINWNGPVMAGDVLLVVGSNGRLLSINPQNGKIITRNKILKDVYIHPVVAYENVYLLNDDARLVKLFGSSSENKFFDKNDTKSIPNSDLDEGGKKSSSGVFDKVKRLFDF